MNFQTLTTKRNNVLVFKFNEKLWKDGRSWSSAEDGKMFCSYCKEFDKTSRNKFVSGCESMRIENVLSHEASNSHKTSHSAFLNSKTQETSGCPWAKPKASETINWRQSVIVLSIGLLLKRMKIHGI